MSRWWAVPLIAVAMGTLARPSEERYTFVHKGYDPATDAALLEPIYPLRLGVIPNNAIAKADKEADILNCTIRHDGVEITIAGEPGIHTMNRIYLMCDGSEYVVLGVQFDR